MKSPTFLAFLIHRGVKTKLRKNPSKIENHNSDIISIICKGEFNDLFSIIFQGDRL